MTARPRVVLLGASNLAMGLPALLGRLPVHLGPGPFGLLVAAGHGRSFGAWSRVLVRGLPGIVECGLWSALDGAVGRRQPGGSPTVHALVTDIGNDLAYGSRPERVAGWVESCLARLAEHGAETVVTRLPLASLERLSPWRFRLVGSVLFPGRRLERRTLLARARELDGRLGELVARYGACGVEMPRGWFRGDGIHLRRGARGEIFDHLLGCFAGASPPGQPPGPAPRLTRLRLLCQVPEHRTLLGVTQRRPQPTAVLGDGSTLSLF